MCFAFGKQIQAREIWNRTLPSNTNLDRAVEVFHTEQFKSVFINVLKDGTVEFRNLGAEFSTTFRNSLGMSVDLDDGAARAVERPDSAHVQQFHVGQF
jgi:hypothetical protein